LRRNHVAAGRLGRPIKIAGIVLVMVGIVALKLAPA